MKINSVSIASIAVQSGIARSNASMQCRAHLTTPYQMIKATILRSFDCRPWGRTLQVSDLLHRICIFDVECAACPRQGSRVATAQVVMAMTCLSRSSGKPWKTLVTNVLPVLPGGFSRNQQKGYDEWRWKGE